MKSVTFVVPGEPEGKQRARKGKHGAFYTPYKTKVYEAKVRDAYIVAAGGEYFSGMITVGIAAYYRIPKSWAKQKKQQAEAEKIAPSKPDIDNILKAVMDGLSGIAYDDDCMVCDIGPSKKRYAKIGEAGRVEVTISGE